MVMIFYCASNYAYMINFTAQGSIIIIGGIFKSDMHPTKMNEPYKLDISTLFEEIEIFNVIGDDDQRKLLKAFVSLWNDVDRTTEV